MIREAAFALAGFLVCFVVVLVGVPLMVFGVLFIQQRRRQ